MFKRTFIPASTLANVSSAGGFRLAQTPAPALSCSPSGISQHQEKRMTRSFLRIRKNVIIKVPFVKRTRYDDHCMTSPNKENPPVLCAPTEVFDLPF